ncbi:hypothetical protein L1987_80311 [Smallanthus sonchifolius]|uniref:Uncharacterized protein n=1 Tax=Smallanthus sonchifolius TaxID=185202 RepID=A0ACB8YMC8_9ASTR|nr:hypothetical protein L1987_80311 [Smallanthus sonchifolius]
MCLGPAPTLMQANVTYRQSSFTNSANNRGNLAAFKEREFYNTKFAHVKSMEELGVLDGVKKLFDNIRWCTLKTMSYTLFKKNCVLSMDTICQMINAPIEDTFGPDDSTHANFHAEKFWKSITTISKYETSHLKASQVIHTSMKLAI